MTSEDYYCTPVQLNILKWIARITGTLEAVLLFYIAMTEFMEEVRGGSPSPLITMINGQYFLVIMLTIIFAGLIMAWWKEWLGGGITLAAYIVLFIGWSDFHGNFIAGMIIASLPAILYVMYGWIDRALRRREEEDSDRE